VPVAEVPGGVRATEKGKPVEPASVERYLGQKFGENLGAVREAMATLAAAYDADELRRRAYPLYEKFRPQVPAGTRGWGVPGELDLDYIRKLASKQD
jgi:hypothetical protein